jgi:type II secretory pathway predicted ATPase ExeA
MRVEVMEYYGLTQPFSQAGYYETQQHTQLLKDIKGAILEGRLIAVCGVVGSGKTVTMRRLQRTRLKSAYADRIKAFDRSDRGW